MAQLIETLTTWLFQYVVVWMLLGAGLFFTIRLRFVQFRRLPEAFRANAEQGIEKARAQYAAIKGNAESFGEKLEESFTAAQTGARVFNGKVLDVFRAQMDAGFAHLNALFNVASVSEAIKLQQEYTKAQAEALQAQSKDLADFAKQVGEQVVEPVKSSITLPFKAA